MKVLVLLFSALLAACGSGPEIDSLSREAVVLAYGDSLTAGKGVSTDVAYPAVLQTLIGRQVINAGISGETSGEGLRRLPGLLSEHQPELVILMEGGNDILRNMDLAATERNLDDMIRLANAAGAEVVLVGMPRKKLLSKTAELYRTLAEKHDVPLQDSIIASLLRKPSMKSDQVHFNAQGYRALAESIQELLTDTGAI